MKYFEVDFKSGENESKRIIKSPINIETGDNLNLLLKLDFFRGTESIGNIEDITLKEIGEEAYDELRNVKKIVGLTISDDFEILNKEVL